jgi:hypothetical protein
MTFLFDSIPIALFIVSFLYLYSRMVFKSWKKAVVMVLVSFLLVIMASFISEEYLPELLKNGGHLYLVVMLSFLFPIIKSKSISSSYFKYSLIVLLIFLIALFFRQLDILVCSDFSIGTHFLWHIVASIGLYQSVKLIGNL